jgi:hypothetical protein
MEKFFAFVGSQILTLILGVFIMGLLTYVVYDTALLFEVEIIHRAPYITLFGMVMIFRLLIMKAPTNREIEQHLGKDPKKPMEVFQLDMIRLLVQVTAILSAWFIMYVTHWIWF